MDRRYQRAAPTASTPSSNILLLLPPPFGSNTFEAGGPNPHVHGRGFYASVAQKEVGVFPYPGAPCKLSETPVTIRMAGPRFPNETRMCVANCWDCLMPSPLR